MQDLSPNQREKQRQIVEAARHVLTTRGLAGATAREVAAAGPLTKSAIHYYFSDMDDLVDRAMGEHVSAFVAALRAAGDRAADPAAAFWATVDAYLSTFAGRPDVAHLWFEYWIDSARKRRLDAVRRMDDAVVAVLADRLTAAGAPAPAEAARSAFTYLLGAVVDQSVDGPAPARTHTALAALTRLQAA